jgi:SprT protein
MAIILSDIQKMVLSKELEVKTREWWDKFNAKFNWHPTTPHYPYPTIKYTLRGAVAGTAIAFPTMEINYNLGLAWENLRDFLDNTIPHEIAHIFTDKRSNSRESHGPEWKRVMVAMGLNPSRCHDYDMTNAQARKVERPYIYKCACKEHRVTKLIHKKFLQHGGRYWICTECKKDMVYSREITQEGMIQ